MEEISEAHSSFFNSNKFKIIAVIALGVVLFAFFEIEKNKSTSSTTSTTDATSTAAPPTQQSSTPVLPTPVIYNYYTESLGAASHQTAPSIPATIQPAPTNTTTTTPALPPAPPSANVAAPVTQPVLTATPTTARPATTSKIAPQISAVTAPADPYGLANEQQYLRNVYNKSPDSATGKWANESLYLLDLYNNPHATNQQKSFAENYGLKNENINVSLYH